MKVVKKCNLGITIELTGDEVALAIDTYLKARGINVFGPRTVRVNGELCQEGTVHVDPSGKVNYSLFYG